MSIDFRGCDSTGLPLVTIVAGCYNHEKYLEETLDSIKDQTYPNIQLIIIDDCSQDGSVAKISEWIEKEKAECIFIPHKENRGICRTLNEALALSKGIYFQGISCDDVMLPEKIENQVNILKKTNNNVGMVFSDAYYIDEEGNKLFGSYIQHHKQFLYIPSGNIFEELLKVNFIPAMSVLLKKEVYNNIGPYDEDLDYEDTDMWIRIAKKFEILFSDFVSVKYRLHEKNLTNYLNFEYNRFKYLIKHIDDSPVAKEELLNVILLAYKRNNSQLSCMRKEYFKRINKSGMLKFFIQNRIPFKFYYLFDKFTQSISK